MPTMIIGGGARTPSILNKRRIVIMDRGLDYAYACKNGKLACFNTHGSTNMSEWDQVHNMSNCEGTAVPDCSGAGPSWGPNMQLPPGTTAPYDYVLALAQSSGRIDAFGVLVGNDDIEKHYPLTPDQFAALTGYASIDIPETSTRRVYRMPYLRGDRLIRYNRDMHKLKSSAITDVKRFFRSMGINSLEMMVEELDYNGFNVKDGNDIAEVVTKYMSFINPNYVEMNMDLANEISKYYNNRIQADGEVFEKSFNFADFDISSIISGAMGFLQDMISAGTQEATRRELTQWVNWFTNQMQIDYNDITTAVAERGPQAGVDHIKNLEKTSWRDIQNYIVNLCGQKGVPVPPVVKQVYDNFRDLKLELIEAAKNPDNPPVYTGGQFPPDNENDNTPDSANGMSGTTIALIAGLGLLAVLIFSSNR